MVKGSKNDFYKIASVTKLINMNTRDTPRSTMSDEEMINDYPRLKREYTLLHEEYRRLKNKNINGHVR